MCARVCMCASGNTPRAVETQALDPPRGLTVPRHCSLSRTEFTPTPGLLGTPPDKPILSHTMIFTNQAGTVTQVFGFKPSKQRLVTDPFALQWVYSELEYIAIGKLAFPSAFISSVRIT